MNSLNKLSKGDMNSPTKNRDFQSPFKFIDLEREKTFGIPSFLPSLNEHKSQILGIKAHKEDSSMSFKRSGTALLGNIKESHAKHENTVGVVPKDIGFGLIKDLIELEEEDEAELFESQNSHKKNRKIKKKKTQRN